MKANNLDIISYSQGVTKLSISLNGEVSAMKNSFKNLTSLAITDDNGVVISEFENINFESVTVYGDDKVTVIFSFPEVSTAAKQIEELNKNIEDLCTALVAAFFNESDSTRLSDSNTNMAMLDIVIRVIKNRMSQGEMLDVILESYPNLSESDIEYIREILGGN